MTTYKVPYGLDFPKNPPGRLIPGRGRAGWTIARFDTLEDARAFMAAHPEARLPSWDRLEALWAEGSK